MPMNILKNRNADKKAFLFNVNKKEIYISNGYKTSIWRGSNTCDSIKFWQWN